LRSGFGAREFVGVMHEIRVIEQALYLIESSAEFAYNRATFQEDL
jgi:hypothetical protein